MPCCSPPVKSPLYIWHANKRVVKGQESPGRAFAEPMLWMTPRVPAAAAIIEKQINEIRPADRYGDADPLTRLSVGSNCRCRT